MLVKFFFLLRKSGVPVSITELRIAQARHGVVFVQTLQGLGGGFDVPLEKRLVERARDFIGEQSLSRARLALDEQRPRQHDCGVYGRHQFGRCNVSFSTAKFGGHWPTFL